MEYRQLNLQKTLQSALKVSVSSSSNSYDLVVLGAGPGGYTAAFRASDLGKKVLMIDKDPNIGGVCLNRGCIPSKSLLHIAKVTNEVESLSKMGVSYTNKNMNLDRLRSWKNSVIKKFNIGLKSMSESRNISFISGEAKFISNSSIEIDTDGTISRIDCTNIIIPTG